MAPAPLRAPRALPVALALLLSSSGAARAAGAGAAPAAPAASEAQPGSAGRRFTFVRVFHGPRAWTDPAAADGLRAGRLDAFGFSTPPNDGLAAFLAGHPAGTIVALAGASGVAELPAEAIERERAALAALRGAGADVSWNLMEEWDQGGGRWVPGGRPRYRGLTRDQAHAAFLRHYLERSPPLGRYLALPAPARGLPLVAQTDYPANALTAFELGVDLCLLERGVDELGDLATGIAFVRGAAAQTGRRWGIDLSLWRTGNGSATWFDEAGRLRGGWSPDYLRRHLYAAFLAGANVVQLEPAVTEAPGGAPNPLGLAVRDFADFALRRHPDPGRPVVPIALLIPAHGGFDPRHGVHDQGEAVWYGDIPWSDGDRMVAALLDLAFPGHRRHGLAPGSPFADAKGAPDPDAFRDFLAAGGDPRPFEPTPTARHGLGLDVLADGAPLPVLLRYRAVVVAGDVVLGPALRDRLAAFARAGGVLVLNARQVTMDDQPLLGVRLGEVATASSSRWLADPGAARAEPAFRFTRVIPGAARVLADTAEGAPLVTARALGRGRVLLATPHGLLPTAPGTGELRVLGIGARLLDEMAGLAPAAEVQGEPIQWVVSRGPRRTVVGLLNGSGTRWSGRVIFRDAPPDAEVTEWVSDVTIPRDAAAGGVAIRATVPAYGVAVYAAEAPRRRVVGARAAP
jgi:hypothetical protein